MTAAIAANNAVVVNQSPINDNLSTSIASNPQQGMADQGVLNAGTATKGTTPPLAPCSPLTISSALEQQQQQAAANNPAVAVVAGGVAPADVPVAVVGGPLMEAPLPSAPTAAAPVPSSAERKWKRTPPTESDSRKLFVGGLPTTGKC